LSSPAFDAVIVHVKLALMTEIRPVVGLTEQPPVPPALKVSAPVPEPPLAVAVPVFPKVMLGGTVRVKAACVALFKVTVKGALGLEML
jgi:hypothetical protein